METPSADLKEFTSVPTEVNEVSKLNTVVAATEPSPEQHSGSPTAVGPVRRKKVSQRQLLANRANGRRSRGPVTELGKRTSSKNALRHGIFSGELLLAGESESDLKALRQRAMDEWRPEGLEEQLLVERLVVSAWRLRRVLGVEQRVFDSMSETSDEFRTGHLVSLFREDLFDKVVRYQGHAGRELERVLKLLRKARIRRQATDAKEEKLEVRPQKEEAA